MHCVILLSKSRYHSALTSQVLPECNSLSFSLGLCTLCVLNLCLLSHCATKPTTDDREQQRPANEGEKKSRQAFLSSSCSASGFRTKTTTTGANFRADLRVSIISNRSAAEYMTETITKTSAINQRGKDWVYFLFCSNVGRERRIKLNMHRMQELVRLLDQQGSIELWLCGQFPFFRKKEKWF